MLCLKHRAKDAKLTASEAPDCEGDVGAFARSGQEGGGFPPPIRGQLVLTNGGGQDVVSAGFPKIK